RLPSNPPKPTTTIAACCDIAAAEAVNRHGQLRHHRRYHLNLVTKEPSRITPELREAGKKFPTRASERLVPVSIGSHWRIPSEIQRKDN
ncbi:unnamed protein product, partial [Callosobruchus maculatus]